MHWNVDKRIYGILAGVGDCEANVLVTNQTTRAEEARPAFNQRWSSSSQKLCFPSSSGQSRTRGFGTCHEYGAIFWCILLCSGRNRFLYLACRRLSIFPKALTSGTASFIFENSLYWTHYRTAATWPRLLSDHQVRHSYMLSVSFQV